MTDHSGNQEKPVEAVQPTLCVKCNEFFGNPANLNMCSSCFRAHTKDVAPAPTKPAKVCTPEPVRNALSEVATSAPGTSVEVPKPLAQVQQQEEQPAAKEAPVPMVCEPVPETKPALEAAIAAAAGTPSRPPQKNKNRCYSCRKKIGLTGFKCRCGYIFCSEHRYSDKHDCPFDYKLAGRKDIAKANPKVVASKINKI